MATVGSPFSMRENRLSMNTAALRDCLEGVAPCEAATL